MDIHYDPPRHTTDFSICYRALLSGDCPLSHSYRHNPITRDEEGTLKWLRTVVVLPHPTDAEKRETMRSDIERAIQAGRLSPAARDMSADDVIRQYTEVNGLTTAEAVAEIIGRRPVDLSI